ncbi:hypothetical protein A5320_08945 [Rheinheimera sp. SA_1]|uniref:hypothetical protein n=1 Tax=Rheinheimera sp. SA_1 TaxID=1827365 RepID=UPI0007FEB656|nr:hypothetical protein [Rheinheimera sp. SA_1]OBP15470.1 hypothetical protein A5320_08945 [Rheinheimera sp. SA_1]
MLKLILVTILLFIAVLLWYCSNRHQRLLKKPLSRHWRLVGTLAAVAAIVTAAFQLSRSTTIFFCLLLLMLWLMLLPFATLLPAGNRHDEI